MLRAGGDVWVDGQPVETAADGDNVEFVGVLRADGAARVDGQPDGTAGNEPLPSRL